VGDSCELRGSNQGRGVDRIEERTRSSTASGQFTPQGVKDDALKFALSDLVPALHRARTTIKKAKSELAERKSKLRIDVPDKSDVAAAFRRMEIRTFLREMKPEDQSKYFATQADNLSNDVAMAILEMPAEFSGVPQSRHDLLTKSALNARHGPEIAELADLEEAIAAVESAVETGRDEVRLEAGALDERNFNELAAPIEAKHDAPWLRRRKDKNGVEEVRVVDLDQGRERLPTREEIENGIEYRDYDHYMEGRAAWTREVKTDARLSTPVDPKKDQAELSRRVLREMWDKADRAIDKQTGRSK
jgi:hypothetical protein